MTIEDYKLELKLLQQKDTAEAFEHGYTTKKEWNNYILTKEEDLTAKALINLANRYSIPIQIVALNFDQTMLKRISKVLKAEIKTTKK